MGNPPPNGVKFFASKELLELAADEKWLHRVTCPTQIIWGENDKVLPAGYAAEFAKHIPSARVEMVAQCGHLLPIEKADPFAALVTAFAKD